ncbi:MAG: metallophosphoesterase family protein [Gammaproteobacteria bacterium]
MRTVVHLSDLHFGQIDEAILAPLIAMIDGIGPDLVAVSGDLTQRAQSSQFEQARALLEALRAPRIVVPGNHDVPMRNLFARFFRPLAKYRHYITEDLAPFYRDEEIMVVGINTARSLTIKGGRINETQIEMLRERLSDGGGEMVRILVTHHPFHVPEGGDEDDLVRCPPEAKAKLGQCRLDVLLAGHLHRGHTGPLAERFRIGGYSALAVSAGTAISTRVRGEPNSFNVLRIEQPHIHVSRHSWEPDCTGFVAASSERFTRTPTGWARAVGSQVHDAQSI